MTAFLTAAHALVWVLAVLGAIWLSSFATVALVFRRAARREPQPVHGPRALLGPIPAPDASDEEFHAWGLAALVPLFGVDAPKTLAQRRQAFERDVRADIAYLTGDSA